MARGSPLPCADYTALPSLKVEDEKLSPRSISSPHGRPFSKSESRATSLHSLPPTPPAAHTDANPLALLLHPPVSPPTVELDHTTRFCCSRASPLVCVNQPLCGALDVLRRGRALESNERSALSYARAIAVSMTLSSFTLLDHSPQAIKGSLACT